MLWRRSYATPPPEIDLNDQYAQNNDPRYADVIRFRKPSAWPTLLSV